MLICKKFSGLACLDMKNICGKFRCKQNKYAKSYRIVFECDSYMRRSTLCAFERMTHESMTHMHHTAPKVLMALVQGKPQ